MEKKIRNSKVLGFLALALFLAHPGTGRGEEEKKDTIGNHRVEGIDVVQPRVFRKGGRHELSIGGGVIPSNTFIFYGLLPIEYTYHFRETFGFEGMFIYPFQSVKGIVQDLGNIPCPSPNSDINGDGIPDTNCGVQLKGGVEAYKALYFGNVLWSPIYGKLSIFSKRIYHFDIFIVAGAGLVDTDTIRTDLAGQPKQGGPNRFGFDVGLGGKLFVNDWLAVRLDIRNFTVRQGLPFNKIANDQMYSLGVSFFLPPHPAE